MLLHFVIAGAAPMAGGFMAHEWLKAPRTMTSWLFSGYIVAVTAGVSAFLAWGAFQ